MMMNGVLLAVTKICVSRMVSFDLVDHLGVLIELHLVSFRKCYPHMSIFLKQHYLVHLPSQILKYAYMRNNIHNYSLSPHHGACAWRQKTVILKKEHSKATLKILH